MLIFIDFLLINKFLMKNINNFNFVSKKILLRVDLNVPVINGKVSDLSRIHSIKSTIFKLRENKNKIFLLSHFGRPKGKFITKYSLEFLCDVIKETLNLDKIFFSPSINEKDLKSTQSQMADGDICLIENIRFCEGEEKNDLDFSKYLSQFFDLYVNDAFSASHREHASIVGVVKFLPAFAGNAFIKEIKNLNIFIEDPKKPTTCILGGSKISTKLSLIENLIEHSDYIIIGGAMANTLLYVQGYNVGRSLIENNMSDIADRIFQKAKNFNCKIILPTDVVCSKDLNEVLNIRHCNIKDILPDQMILDIGDKTISNIKNILIKSKTILWNGPLGAFEKKPFDNATNKIVDTINKNAKKLNIVCIAGGGDTLSAINKTKESGGFSYISTAGGAFLEWLEGKESPGVKALRENKLI